MYYVPHHRMHMNIPHTQIYINIYIYIYMREALLSWSLCYPKLKLSAKPSPSYIASNHRLQNQDKPNKNWIFQFHQVKNRDSRLRNIVRQLWLTVKTVSFFHGQNWARKQPYHIK
eukprot:TRINITY_DN14309_c0_g1_i1.p1 TRINITY_DN14309_c0_g1~~TRINITY_DN14309_c0_g1_i1.p1  ORF type:complete len:115 (-),score=2.63 TRINITY_DN14309_c0_g1_i1:54-398(-)